LASLNGLYQSGDWKGEKHVPVIHAPETTKAGENVEVQIIIGEEIPHPNTFEHHIVWIKLYYQQEGAKFPVEIGTYNFGSHGENDLYTDASVTTKFQVEKSGTLIASSYCNIHGLWENTAQLKVE